MKRNFFLLAAFIISFGAQAQSVPAGTEDSEKLFSARFESAYQDLKASFTEEDKVFFEAHKVTIKAKYPGRAECSANTNPAVTEFDGNNIQISICIYPVWAYAQVILAQSLFTMEYMRASGDLNGVQILPFIQGEKNSLLEEQNNNVMAAFYYFGKRLKRDQTKYILSAGNQDITCDARWVAFHLVKKKEIGVCATKEPNAEVAAWIAEIFAHPSINGIGYDRIWSEIFSLAVYSLIGHELGHLAPSGASGRNGVTVKQKIEIEQLADRFSLVLVQQATNSALAIGSLYNFFLLWAIIYNQEDPFQVHIKTRLFGLVSNFLCNNKLDNEAEPVLQLSIKLMSEFSRSNNISVTCP